MARGDGTGGTGESEKGEKQILNIRYQISDIKILRYEKSDGVAERRLRPIFCWYLFGHVGINPYFCVDADENGLQRGRNSGV